MRCSDAAVRADKSRRRQKKSLLLQTDFSLRAREPILIAPWIGRVERSVPSFQRLKGHGEAGRASPWPLFLRRGMLARQRPLHDDVAARVQRVRAFLQRLKPVFAVEPDRSVQRGVRQQVHPFAAIGGGARKGRADQRVAVPFALMAWIDRHPRQLVPALAFAEQGTNTDDRLVLDNADEVAALAEDPQRITRQVVIRLNERWIRS